MKKRSTYPYPTERTVHWLEDGSGNNDMINKYSNIHNTKALTSAIFSNPDLSISQLANDFVKTFGHDTKGLSYHTGINWRLGS